MNAAKVSVKQRSLVIAQDGSNARIPLEDIWVVIFESHHIQVSTAALAAIVDAGIGVMICNDSHMPSGLLLPIGAHSRHAAIVDDQLAISKPMQKRLWQHIVIEKIKNQARVLELLGKPSDSLMEYASSVFSGDTTNRESVAAAAYFRQLLPEGGRRDGPYSGPLDYGYSVLRAGIAREAVSGGWLVSRGIHHCNNLNAFNLVDDLIEPFRPVVDLLVLQEHLGGPLTHINKVKIARVFECLVKSGGKTMSVQNAIRQELSTLRNAVLESDYDLLQLPSIIPLDYEQME